MNKPTNTVKRPKKAPLRSELVMLRFTAAQYRALLRASNRAGFPIATLCRTLVLEAIDQGRERRLRGNVLHAHSASPGQETVSSPLPRTGS